MLFFLRLRKENRKHLQHLHNILIAKLCQFYLCCILHIVFVLHCIGEKIGENYRVLNEFRKSLGTLTFVLLVGWLVCELGSDSGHPTDYH
jgi:hypothetical protein